MQRYAIVRGARDRAEAAAYLPGNYSIIFEQACDTLSGLEFVIAGEDSRGWTLEGYISPRYASGLIGCQEIDLSHPIMRKIPAPAGGIENAKSWTVPAPYDAPELELEPEQGEEPNVSAYSRADWVLSELGSLVSTEPAEPEQMLARVMLAAGALYARDLGTLSQCLRTAAVWERG